MAPYSTHPSVPGAPAPFKYGMSQSDDLQRSLFHVFTFVALTFLGVYTYLQAKAGLPWLAALYASVALIIAVNRWAIRFHNRLALAANVFASLGPVVLLPWQVSGGISGSGLMWFPAYVVFVMFFVPGVGGSFWVMFTYSTSFFMLLLQMQGLLPMPFPSDIMFHFYFVGGITYTLILLFLRAKQVNFEVQTLQLAALKKTETMARVGNCVWDIAANEVHWSDQLYQLFGLDPRKKVTYESYLQIVDPDDRPLIERTIQEALRDYQPYSLIHRVRRPDGSIIWVHALGEVMRDDFGKPVQMFGTVQDITERVTGRAEPGLMAPRVSKQQHINRDAAHG